MSTEKRTGNSISSRLRRLMMILVPLSALYIGISVASTYYFKKQIVSYAETFVDFYIDKIENTVTNINRRMSMLIDHHVDGLGVLYALHTEQRLHIDNTDTSQLDKMSCN